MGDFSFDVPVAVKKEKKKEGEESPRLFVEPKPKLTDFATVVDLSATSTTQAPQPVPSSQRAGMRPGKIPLEKGYSQVEWIRKSQAAKDLAGLKGQSPRRVVSMDELKKHNTAEDAWIGLKGIVYNMTPYLRFHPGGVKILISTAGKDGTAVFQKYHAWVNAEKLLEKCVVGVMETEENKAEG